MKRILILLLILFSAPAFSQESLKARMDRIEKDFGVSFVYASSLSPELRTVLSNEYGDDLSGALASSFKGTGIRYKIHRGNVILSVDRSGKAAKSTVCGLVTDAGSGEILIGASVIVTRPGGAPVGAVTNEYGFYTITIEEGEYLLEVSYLGYSPIRRPLTMEKDLNLSFALTPDARISESGITSRRDAGILSTRPGSTVLSASLIESTPAVFGEPDILKTIQLLPGVQNANDGFSGINVRGGGLDENLILLDGSALYNTNHLLGLTSMFSPDMVKKTTVYKSAFPARYGGRTSSVVDVRSKDGNLKETHASLSIGLLADKLSIEGPLKKDKVSFALSGRLMQTGVFSPVMKAFGVPANYWFYDLNAKLTYVISDRDRLYAGIFNGYDNFRFSQAEEEYRHYYDDNYAPYDMYCMKRQKLGLRWGNTLGTLRWNHVYSPRLFSNLTVAANRYSMSLSNGSSVNVDDDGEMSSCETSFSMSSGIMDLRAQMDFDYTPSPAHLIRFGAEAIGHKFRPESSSSVEKTTSAGVFSDERTDMQKGKVHYGIEASLYVEDNMLLAGWLTFCPGIRLSTFITEGRTYVSPEPRLSLKADLREDLFAKASLTRMTQFVHMLTSGNTSLPTDMWVPSTKNIRPTVSDQASIGLYYTGLDGWEFSSEGYWKTMNNVLEYLEVNASLFSSINWEQNVAMGKGRSFGLELMVEKTTGKATGMLAYTISKSDRVFPDGSVNGGRRFPYVYDRRHKLTSTVNYSFNDRIDATATWTFASGAWFTVPTRHVVSVGPDGYLQREFCVTERNNYRLPPVHHLDVGVNFRKQKRVGERIWNIGVYNIYGARNPTLLTSSMNDAQFENPDLPDGAIVITRRSLFMFMPSVTYTRKF